MEGTRRPARHRDAPQGTVKVPQEGFHTNRPAAQQAGIQGEGTNRQDSIQKNKKKRKMPPVFTKYIQKILKPDGEGPLHDRQSMNYIQRYYRNLHYEDSHFITVSKGGKNSGLEKLLMRDALRRNKSKNETEGTGWRVSKAIGAGSYGEVTLWQKDLPDGQLANLAAKDHRSAIPFYIDYNNEGNAVRRLNDSGCKNVIEILDWVGTGSATFRQIFEYAKFGSVHDILQFYYEHGLVFPEAFVWHVFYCMANALCYCRYGTNDLKPGLLAKRGWDQIYHQDIKADNVLMNTPDNECHRLYPCHKLADFGLACNIGKIEVDSSSRERNPVQLFKTGFIQGARANKPPESRKPARMRGALKEIPMDRLQGSHSDVYALGMLMADLCKPADTHLSNVARFQYSRTGQSRTRLVSAYYSEPLKDLIRQCRSKLGKDRPDAHALYEETKEKMEQYRAAAYAAEERSQGHKLLPGYLFHEKVLFTKTDQDLFREDSFFRGLFLDTNLGPVREAENTYFNEVWNPPGDDYDTSINTDHHSSTDRRRTAPEARVKTKLGKEFISTAAFHAWVEVEPSDVNRFSASRSTTEDDLSDGPSFLPDEISPEPPVAPRPARAADDPPNEADG